MAARSVRSATVAKPAPSITAVPAHAGRRASAAPIVLFRVRVVLPVLALLGAFTGSAVAQPTGDVFDQFYRYVERKNRLFEPHLPGEVVDHFSGTLRIVQEDLSFPGKAGLDLRIVRTYSSRIWGRTDLFVAEPLLADKVPSVVGFGWSMHMGRLQNPTPATTVNDYPVYEAADGTARVFYPDASGNQRYKSRDFWKLDTGCSTAGGAGACITTTNGLRLEFANANRFFFAGSTKPTWPLSNLVDVFGNSIEVEYQPGGGAFGGSTGRIRRITDTYGRVVDFNYAPGCSTQDCQLETLVATFAGGTRTMNYSYTRSSGMGGAGYFALPGNRSFLTGVQPAAGPGYTYDYHFGAHVAENQYALAAITYPYGGKTEYTYVTRQFFTGCQSTAATGVPMAVVRRRETFDRAAAGGTARSLGRWEYDYASPSASDFQTTTVTRPDNLEDRYEFYGFGYPANPAHGQAPGSVWIVGLQARITRGSGGETETLEWEKGDIAAQARYAAPSYDGACPTNWSWDDEVRAPRVTKRTVVRGASRYETVPSNYDRYGQPRTVTETGEAQRSQGRQVRVTTYEYDYDDAGASATYQVVGRVAREEVCQGTGSSDCYENTRTFQGPQATRDTETLKGIQTRFSLWPDGNLWKVENALGETLTLEGYTTGFGMPTSIDYNGAFAISRTAYGDGSLKSESNGRGDLTSYAYDAAGRIRTVTPPGNNEPTTYDYDTVGKWFTATRGTGASQFVETTTVDGLGRAVELKNSLGDMVRREHDAFGRVSFLSYPFRAGAPEVGDRFEFDALGRPTVTSRRFVATGHGPLTGACSVASACKSSTTYAADHCRTITVDRAMSDVTKTTACYASFGNPDEERLVSVTDGNLKRSKYTYDVAGQLKTFDPALAAGNRSSTYAPGTLLLSTTTTGPSGTSRVLSRNAVGQPLTRSDGSGVVTTLIYGDLLSRLTNTQFQGGGASEDTTRTYDRDVLKTVSSAEGGSYSYDYDELSRVTSQTWQFLGRTYTTTYHYDRTGCMDRVTYPTGADLRTSCDAWGRPETVMLASSAISPPEVIASNVRYHPDGRPSGMTLGNGLTVTIAMENGRVKSIETPGVLRLTYTYDGADNVKSITDGVVPANTLTNVVYDKLNRLFDVTTSAGLLSYRYDDLGNRIRKSAPGAPVTTYTYDTRSNRLTGSSGPSGMPPMTLTWSAAGRLTQSSDGSTYRTDALGRRVWRQPPNGNETVYHYDLKGRLLAETRADGARVREYVYIADQLTSVDGCISATAPCNEREWYHTDLVKSVVARTDRLGAVTRRRSYPPWGESATPDAERAYAGRARDSGTGLYEFGARPYSPELGRFISADVIWPDPSDPQSSNPYIYVLDNPLKYTDPSGAQYFPVNWLSPINVVSAWLTPRPSPAALGANATAAVNWLRANYPNLFPSETVTIVEGNPGEDRTGFTNPVTGNITIAEGLSTAEAVSTIAHELLHSRPTGLRRALTGGYGVAYFALSGETMTPEHEFIHRVGTRIGDHYDLAQKTPGFDPESMRRYFGGQPQIGRTTATLIYEGEIARARFGDEVTGRVDQVMDWRSVR